MDESRNGIGFNTAFVFGGFSIITCVICWFYVPEPARRNAAEMDEMYEKRVPAWKMSKYVTDVQRAHQARATEDSTAQNV